jgi:hypothetical protein
VARVESNQNSMQVLRGEIAQLLADAIRAADQSAANASRVADETRVETDRVQQAHSDEMRTMDRAVASRDIIGQAKGIIMVTMNCDAEQAFDLIRTQSQAENRKAIDVATEIAARVTRRSRA